jgi:hypothetical protein
MENNDDNIHGEQTASQIKEALNALEHEWVQVDGIRLKPSQCYHFEMDPPHVLFNTNCPEDLKEKVESILTRYGVEK